MPIIIPRPVIDHMEPELDKDVAGCIVRFGYDINWPEFARSTNLAYQEKVELVNVDPGGSPMVLYTWPLRALGIQPNGVTTHRTFEQAIPWADRGFGRPRRDRGRCHAHFALPGRDLQEERHGDRRLPVITTGDGSAVRLGSNPAGSPRGAGTCGRSGRVNWACRGWGCGR
jgi:hypothetical protein